MKRRKINYSKCLSLFFAMIVLTLFAGCSGTTPTTPIINSFLANPTNITAGESSNLSWSVTDAITVVINQSVGSVASTGTTAVTPTTTTTYILTATNTAGTVTASVTVTVGAAYGSIDINSSPTGATVYLDGADTGQITPIVLTNVSAGMHTVKLELYHYESKEDTTILVTAGETTYLNWALTYATTLNLILQPGAEGKDAYVRDVFPNTNYGNSTNLSVGYGDATFLRYRAYLYFDVSSSSLPSDAVVTTAYLKLLQSGFEGTGSLPIGLYQVTEDWTEDAITWNNQPGSSSDAEYTNYVYSSTDAWRSWNIEDLLKGWMDGSITNYGMLLKPVSEPATNLAYFYSSDYPNNARHPQLVIDYYIP